MIIAVHHMIKNPEKWEQSVKHIMALSDPAAGLEGADFSTGHGRPPGGLRLGSEFDGIIEELSEWRERECREE